MKISVTVTTTTTYKVTKAELAEVMQYDQHEWTTHELLGRLAASPLAAAILLQDFCGKETVDLMATCPNPHYASLSGGVQQPLIADMEPAEFLVVRS